jgi:thiol-disulfide isomerase/thioredoxin
MTSTIRLIALILSVYALISPAYAFEPAPDGEFARKVIALTDSIPAPETAIDTPDGRLSLSDFRGRVALVTLWATWCHVCDIEMPILNGLSREFRPSDLVLVPVSVDQHAALDLIAVHLESHGLKELPVMHDRYGALAKQVGLRGTPTTIIVDKFGQVVAAFEGLAPWDEPETRSYLNALIDAPDADASRFILKSLN